MSEHDTSNTHNADIPSNAMILDPASIDPQHPGSVHNADLYVVRGIESSSDGESPGADDEALAAESPALMVAEVEGRIAKLEQQLATNTGFDPVSGAPVPLVKGRARENAERELAVLRHTSLPYTKMRAAEIAAAKAALPTTADKLQAQADKEARINARALELADEEEAKVRAERIKAQRRAQSMG